MRNLIRMFQFFTWLNQLSEDVHLGNEIIANNLKPKFNFLSFNINFRPKQIFFVKVLAADRKPIEGFLISMTLDPKHNLLSVQIRNELSNNSMIHKIALDKLNSFEKLSTSMPIEKIRAKMNIKTAVAIAKASKPPKRGLGCDLSANHPRSAFQI